MKYLTINLHRGIRLSSIFKLLLVILICLFIYFISCKKSTRNFQSNTKIIVNKSIKISDMFARAIELYNTRISYLDDTYNKIKKCNGYIKAIVVLLSYKEIIPFINNNIGFLRYNYHDKLIFFVTENKTGDEEYKTIKYSINDVSDVFYKFPYRFNESSYLPNFHRRGKWNYQHMCRFFFREIFMHPSLCDVDIIMRLDSESILNTTINLFKMMNSDYVYMHNIILNDAGFVTQGLKNFTYSFVKLLNIEIKDKKSYNIAFRKNVLYYYNNFEICRLKFFRSKEMIEFANLVDLSYGQFIYRWGDAPLRYISLSLFARNNIKIQLPKIVNYFHPTT